MRTALFALLAFAAACRTPVEDTAPDPSSVDDDGDGFSLVDDCDDANALVNPGAAETCDGVDNDCDGAIDEEASDAGSWFTDRDGDGYGSGDPTVACVAPAGTSAQGEDCDDTRPNVYPGAPEPDCTDPVDYNCDGSSGFDDVDGDGVPACEDCDDTEARVHPGAAEVCDELDNDCDGEVDVNALDAALRYADADADGYGDASAEVRACGAPEGTTDGPSATDCDDTSASTYPGAPERCDDVDQDCDGEARDDDATDASTWYADLDGDGHAGDRQSQRACDAPSGHFAEVTDCDDLRAAARPGATELCNGLDDDCDGEVDEEADLGTVTFYADADGDGFGDPASTVEACDQPTGYAALDTDCDDARADVNPRAPERCDDADNDCDGQTDEADAVDAPEWYRDVDGDGHAGDQVRLRACEAPTSYFAEATDCDDLRADAHPGASELCNGLDDDCDGQLPANESDADDDDHLACDGDCDDARADVYPGAPERCDNVDQDCDGQARDNDAVDAPTWYLDADDDGYGRDAPTVKACDAPESYVDQRGDCDDLRPAVNPDADEVCNGRDDDCDGVTDPASSVGAPTWYADADNDGFGDRDVTRVQCQAPTGYVADSDDCDDADDAINPDADEVCDDVDRDCDGDTLNGPPGSDALCAGGTCLEILDALPGAANGDYWIDPDGTGGLDPWQARCDMTTSGGGWTAVPYAADLTYQNHFPTGGNAARWLPQNFRLAWTDAQIAALRAASTEARQRYVGLCNGSLHWFYTSEGNYNYAFGFRLHTNVNIPGQRQSYAPFQVNVPQDGCRANGGEGGNPSNATIFDFSDLRLPLVNVQSFDNGDSNELFGSPLTQNPAWFR